MNLIRRQNYFCPICGSQTSNFLSLQLSKGQPLCGACQNKVRLTDYPILRVMTIGQARDYLSLRDKNYRDFAIFNSTRSIEFEPYVLNVDDQKSLWYFDEKKCNPPLIFTFDDLLDFNIDEQTEVLKEIQEQDNSFLDWLICPAKRAEKPISGILVSEISLKLKVRNSPLETLSYDLINTPIKKDSYRYKSISNVIKSLRFLLNDICSVGKRRREMYG